MKEKEELIIFIDDSVDVGKEPLPITDYRIQKMHDNIIGDFRNGKKGGRSKMLEFKLLENTEEFVSYIYYPHGETGSGYLKVSKKDCSIIEHQVAESDEFKTYFFHMYKKIKIMLEDELLDEGYVVWY